MRSLGDSSNFISLYNKTQRNQRRRNVIIFKDISTKKQNKFKNHDSSLFCEKKREKESKWKRLYWVRAEAFTLQSDVHVDSLLALKKSSRQDSMDVRVSGILISRIISTNSSNKILSSLTQTQNSIKKQGRIRGVISRVLLDIGSKIIDCLQRWNRLIVNWLVFALAGLSNELMRWMQGPTEWLIESHAGDWKHCTDKIYVIESMDNEATSKIQFLGCITKLRRSESNKPLSFSAHHANNIHTSFLSFSSSWLLI